MKILYDQGRCTACKRCARVCPQKILEIRDKRRVVVLDEGRCMGCFGCEDECREGAIRVLRSRRVGQVPALEPPPEPLLDAYDVVVVGAGPSGLGAAIECARRGLEVCVCERLPNRELSHHPDGGVLMTLPGLPGVAATARGVAIPELDLALPELGEPIRLDRLGIMGPKGLKTGDEFPAGVEPGLITGKDELVRALANEAERQGATLYYGVKVVDFVKRGEAFAGVVLHDGRELGAKVVVCADGIQGKMSRKAGLPNNEGVTSHAVILSMEFEDDPKVPRGLFYMDGDLKLEPDMPPAMAGVGVARNIHVMMILLFEKKWYKAPRPIDHYLRLYLERDDRVRHLLGDALDGVEPLMLNGCRAVIHKANRDVVRDGLVSVGDAWVGGGELSNVGALVNGVRTGEVIVEAVGRGDTSRAALSKAADFITDDIVKMTEMNGAIKELPLRVSEEELTKFFEVMADASYPVMLFGKGYQQAWMFTKLMAKHAWDFIKDPHLLQLVMGKG